LAASPPELRQAAAGQAREARGELRASLGLFQSTGLVSFLALWGLFNWDSLCVALSLLVAPVSLRKLAALGASQLDESGLFAGPKEAQKRSSKEKLKRGSEKAHLQPDARGFQWRASAFGEKWKIVAKSAPQRVCVPEGSAR